MSFFLMPVMFKAGVTFCEPQTQRLYTSQYPSQFRCNYLMLNSKILCNLYMNLV